MSTLPLAIFLTNDLSAISRGRAFPAADIANRRQGGVGWVPANLALTPFGVIAPDHPFGPVGDLRLLADDDAGDGVQITGFGSERNLTAFLCDIRQTDGSEWTGCGRTLLKRALADLKAEAELDVRASFEHEFLLSGVRGPTPQAFCVHDLRAAQPFAEALMAALDAAGIEPEMILPEYGPSQFEVTVKPAAGLQAADRAVMMREITRDVARQIGLKATFAPIVDPNSVGNGVHLHLSLLRSDGSNATADLGRPGEVSEVTGSFVAGVLRHLPALCAVLAPSTISYLRLTPHRWSAGFTAFGHRNREAAVRICPTIDLPGFDRTRQIHLEFRAADAAASPYLVLALVLRAGLQGLREKLLPPPLIDCDPADLDVEEARRLDVRRLPESLPAALAALQADPVALDWLPEPMRTAYFAIKRMELAMAGELPPAEQCARYAEVY